LKFVARFFINSLTQKAPQQYHILYYLELSVIPYSPLQTAVPQEKYCIYSNCIIVYILMN